MFTAVYNNYSLYGVYDLIAKISCTIASKIIKLEHEKLGEKLTKIFKIYLYFVCDMF